MRNNFFSNLFKKSENDGRYSLYKSINRTVESSKVLPKTGLDLNETSLYLNKGILKRGEKIGETEFIVKNLKGDILQEHWLYDLLDRPNKYQTGDQFFKLASIYKDATGFVVIKKIGNDSVFNENSKISELHLLNSMGITINYNENKTEIVSFNYTNPNSGLSEVVPFNQCIYWYQPDPKNHLAGLSIISSGLQSVLTDKEMTYFQQSVFKNGGFVDGIISYTNVLNQEQLDKLKASYKKEYGNTDNAGLPIFLGGDAKYTRLGLEPNELDFINSKKVLIDDIVSITGVPKSLLGLTSGETFANAEIGLKIFLRETIKPLVRDLVNVLNWRLAPNNVILDYTDPTPEDNDLILKKLDTGSKVNALTLNEKRAYLGLDEIKGGDEIDKPEAPAPKEKGIYVHPLKNKDFRKIYYGNYIKSLNSKKAKFKAELKKYFQSQEKRLIQSITSRKQVKVKGLAEEIFNPNLELVLATPLLNTMKEIAIEAGQETMDIFGLGRDYVFGEFIDNAVDKRFNFFAEKINATTADKLKKEVSDWYDNNETINQLKERVESIYGQIDEWRLNTIVNTETASVMQNAKFDSYKQIGLQTKIWVWSAGIKGGVRDNHLALDGEEKPIDMPFSNGMMYPMDENFGAEDTVNCECSI